MDTGQPSDPSSGPLSQLAAAKTVIMRRPLFYLGNVLALVGILLFLSTFLTAALNFGNFDHFDERGRSMALRAFSGIVLIGIGGALSGASATRSARSRLLQNFEQLRDQVQLNAPPQEVPPVRCAYCNVENDPKLSNCTACGAPLSKKRRCTGCGTVNDPNAKFCNQCGASL
jgi:Double zinc ribbon